MMAMARKGLAICGGIAVIGGGLTGLGLANYAQSGAFDFYKAMPPPAQQAALAAPSDSAGYYPISRAAPVPAYPEDLTPPRPLTIARAAEPADYSRAAVIDEPAPAVEEQAALPDPEPVIAPHRGSWTAPEETAAAPPEEATPGDTSS